MHIFHLISDKLLLFFLLLEPWMFPPRQVTAGFQTTNMLTALPSSFLEPLLSFSLNEDPEVRLLVLQILLSLIDRHDNAAKFSNIRSVRKISVSQARRLWSFHIKRSLVSPHSIISDISVLKLKVDKCSRQDNLFMKKVRSRSKRSGWLLQSSYLYGSSFIPALAPPAPLTLQHGQQLYRHIYLGCKELSSGRQHYETLFTLLGLLSVELANEEVVVDLIRLALALQVPAAGHGLSWFIASFIVLQEENKMSFEKNAVFFYFTVFKNMNKWKKKTPPLALKPHILEVFPS